MPVSKNAIKKAERNARIRDLENDRVLTAEELKQVNEASNKAAARGMKLVPERRVKNGIKFVQILTENFGFLQDHKYITTEEVMFLTGLVRNIGFGSNAIVDDYKKKQPIAINQTQIATVLGTSKTKISRVVNNLVSKGILAKSESGIEGNNVKSYVLFVNPNILFNGDKDNVNETLQIMFSKAMKMPLMKQLPDKLF